MSSHVMESFVLGILFGCVWTVNSESDKEVNASIFVFGDSLYDPGNQNYRNVSILDKANYWPYGETFFNFSTGRFCDGRVVPDFLAMKANLPLWKPYLGNEGQNLSHGANFAASSAGVLPETDLQAINLGMQVGLFKEVASRLREEAGEEEAKAILMESVYLSSIGGDDYNNFYSNSPNATESDQTQFVNEVIANFTLLIKEIYEIGGRKFAFQNVGPMGCLPVAKAMYGLTGDNCVEALLELPRLHNKLLLETAQELERQLEGFKYMVFDYYTWLYDIIHYPSNYGFNVSDAACCDGVMHCGIEPYWTCSNVREYVFWDKAHPTEATHMLSSSLMWNGDSTFAFPYNFQQLLHLPSNSTLSSFSINNPTAMAKDSF